MAGNMEVEIKRVKMDFEQLKTSEQINFLSI